MNCPKLSDGVRILVSVGTNGVPVRRTEVGVVTAGLVGSTAVGVVTATSKGKEVDNCRVRANKEPINTVATRIAMKREIRTTNAKVGFVLSESPDFSQSAK